MAVLEFEFKGIDQNFRSSASNVLNDIDKIKKAFGSIGSGAIDNSGITKSFDEVKIAIKQAESDNRMFLANKLADTRQAGIEEANAIKNSELQKQQAYKTTSEAWKASALEQKSVGVDLDNQRKQSLLNIAKLNEEQKRYNATQREAREATKSIVYPIDSVVGMRNRLNELRAIHDKLSESQRNGTRVQSNLVTEINRLNTAVSKAEQATGRYQRNVGNYQQAQSGANGVAMEFNRIIQDAPYGMMGIGNNIQQLAANWQSYTEQVKAAAAANGTTVTSMGLMKGAFSALLSPANLLTLGIAAATSAWTYYTMQSQKSNKATKEAKESVEDLRKSMDLLSLIQAETSLNASKDITKLNMLSEVYKSNKVSIEQRKYALNGIINLYKSYFPNLDNEQAKIKALAGNYLDLANQIIKASKARAYDKMFEEKQSSLINSKGNQSTLRKEIDNAINEYRKEVEKGGRKLNLTNQEIFNKFYQQLKKYQDSGFPVSLSSDRVSGSLFSGVKGVDAVNDAILRYSESTRRTAKSQKELNDLRAEFVKDVEKGNVDILGGGGVVSTSDVDNSRAISNNLSSTADNVKQTIDYLKELQSLSGVSEKDISLVGKVGVDAEIAGLSFDFNENIKEVEKFQEKVLADTTLTESKRAEIIAETNKTIQYLMGNASANMKASVQANTDAIDKMTVKAVKTYKDVEIVASPKQKQGRNREDDKDSREWTTILKSSIDSVFTNLKTNVDEFGWKARSVFYTLGESFSGFIDQLKEKNMGKFMKELTKTNEEGITNIAQNWKEMNKDLKISAGLGYAGGVVQSFGGAAGNIIGGGLSGAAAGLSAGAATGATGGGAYGAVIGAVVGMTAGILKEAKNRRQEKYLIKQIEEQKKANRLLERMSALSYASQIIGQKTEYGIVSGVRRNEFGQIVSVVQGQDIIMVADRTNKQKGR